MNKKALPVFYTLFLPKPCPCNPSFFCLFFAGKKQCTTDRFSNFIAAILLAFSFFIDFSAHGQSFPNPEIYQLRDGLGTNDFQSVQHLNDSFWQKVESADFGGEEGSNWVKFRFQSDRKQTIWVEVKNHFIDSLTIFTEQTNGHKDRVQESFSDFKHQPIRHRYFLFPVHTEDNKTYIIYLKGSLPPRKALNSPIVVWRPEAFLEQSRNEHWGWALFVGVMIMAIVLSLVNFCFRRAPASYLYFAGYVIFINAYVLLNDGWGVYLPSSLKFLDNDNLVGHWINLGICCFMLFSRRFLSIKDSKRTWLVHFNPLFIMVFFEMAIFVADAGTRLSVSQLYAIGYSVRVLLAFGYLIFWFLYVADAIERQFKPVWLHIASMVVFASFLGINKILVGISFLQEPIPDMLVLRYAIALDILVILIGWVYRQKMLEQQHFALEVENRTHQRAVQEAVEMRRVEEVRALSLQNEMQMQRVRLARDLHDGIGSELTHIINRLDILAFKSNQQQPLLSLGDFTRATNQNLRDTLWILNQQSISTQQWYERMLAWFNKVWEDRETPQLHTEFNYSDVINLGPTIANAIFRITQEAINNALKYANAQEIVFSLNFDGENLALTVADDGKGFDPRQVLKGYGLANMQARIEELGGSFTLVSDSGGTMIRIDLPV